MGLWSTTGKPRFFCKIDYNDDKNNPLIKSRKTPARLLFFFLYSDVAVWIYNNYCQGDRELWLQKQDQEVRANLIAKPAYIELLSHMKHCKCYG